MFITPGIRVKSSIWNRKNVLFTVSQLMFTGKFVSQSHVSCLYARTCDRSIPKLNVPEHQIVSMFESDKMIISILSRSKMHLNFRICRDVLIPLSISLTLIAKKWWLRSIWWWLSFLQFSKKKLEKLQYYLLAIDLYKDRFSRTKFSFSFALNNSGLKTAILCELMSPNFSIWWN